MTTDPIATLRAAGKLTVEDEARLVWLDAVMVENGNDAVRRIMGPVVAEQVQHYEAAKSA